MGRLQQVTNMVNTSNKTEKGTKYKAFNICGIISQ